MTIARPSGPPTTPNPGSPEAVWRGCICAVIDNNRGQFAPWPPDGWFVSEGCPLHWRRPWVSGEDVSGGPTDAHDQGTQGPDSHVEVRGGEQAPDDDLVDPGDVSGMPDGDGRFDYSPQFDEGDD